MHIKIWVKFLIIYILFAFVSVFALAAIIPARTEDAVIKDRAGSMYREATILSSNYSSRYYNKDDSDQLIKKDLDPISAYLESSIWIVTKSGQIMLSVGNNYTIVPPETIKDFHPEAFNKTHFIRGSFSGIFKEDTLSVCAPITIGYRNAGYVLIHTPIRRITTVSSSIITLMLIAFIVVFVLSLCLLAAYFYFVQRPLFKIVTAAREYGAGNLAYRIPIDTNDEFGYLAASLNDMASRLDEMEDTQKKFIANVSHDFRSPLTSIKGYSEAIADGTIPPEHSKKYLDIIVFETERLTDLTTDLLTLSDLTAKGKSLSYSDFDINEMIKLTATSFQNRCLEKKIGIDLLFADYHSMVHADRSKIQQVLYNLIDNAIKFSNADSTITIETTYQGSKLLISIKDDGVGIPKASLEKIWDRFYKIDQSRGKDKKGTGLGLAIVKEIIQAHGETIHVTSTENVGTEFTFTLTKVEKHD